MKKALACLLLSLTLLAMSLQVQIGAQATMVKPRRMGYVLIIRDNYGVPHVFSPTKEGLSYGAGYAMAQDRLWQADVFRRAAFGRLAEIDLATVEQDYATRATGYSWEELGEMFENWIPTQPEARLKEMALAFVDGINRYIEEATGALAGGDPSLMPVEYLASGLLPEPWAIEDSMTILAMMAWRFGGTGGNELQYAAALQALQALHGEADGWQMFNDHFPQNDPGAEVTIPTDGCSTSIGWYSAVEQAPDLPINLADAFEHYVKSEAAKTQLLESLGVPTKFGSNAWLISPENSETGNAMQVGGPQMGHSIPQIVLEVGLHGAGINAVGMMMPMFPSILIGVSEFGAWTSTTGVSDVMDTYMEVLNPGNPTQYWHNGEWVDMEVRIETIYDATGTPTDFPVYRTIHGPIILMNVPESLAFTMKTPYYKNDVTAEEGWSLFQQARSIWDFQEACKTIQPSHNFLWVDRQGNIGYWHAGNFPIKPETGKEGRVIDDRFPLWGTGEEEWVGLTGFTEMPRCINPEQGWLANWNNKPIANWPFAESDAGWGEGHRVSEIMDTITHLLTTKGEISFTDMNLINIAAGYHHWAAGLSTTTKKLFHYLLEAAEDAAPGDLQVAAALPYLQAWNHQYNDQLPPSYPDPVATYDDPALTIFDEWFDKILDEVFEDEMPEVIIGPIHREYANVWPSTLVHVFDGPNSKLPLYHDYLNGEDRDEVIIRTLKSALDDLEVELGADMSTWLTPVRIAHFDEMGALPDPTMHAMNRGTYNQIVEMPRFRRWWWWRPPHAVNVIPPGQSGFVNYMGAPSPHAYDQLLLYETWTYKPMLFRFRDILEVAESWTFLTNALRRSHHSSHGTWMRPH
jgi:penicillin amidase